jgi:hypothetical protein
MLDPIIVIVTDYSKLYVIEKYIYSGNIVSYFE